MIAPAPWTWRDRECGSPCAVVHAGAVRVYHRGRMGGRDRIGMAWADAGPFHPANLRDHPANPLLDTGPPGAWDAASVACPSVVRWAGAWAMFYEGRDEAGRAGVGAATSVDGIVWVRYPGNPVLRGAAPSAVAAADGTLRVWFRDGDALAVSASRDGITWDPPARITTPEPLRAAVCVPGDGGAPLLLVAPDPGRPGLALAPCGGAVAPVPATGLLLPAGDRGAWDDGGVWPGTLVTAGGRTWLLYEGWGAGYRDGSPPTAAVPSPPAIGAAEVATPAR